MGGDSRDPVKEYGIKGNSGHPAEQKRLSWSFFYQYKKEGNEGDPGEKYEFKLGKGKGSEHTAQNHQKNIPEFNFHESSPCGLGINLFIGGSGRKIRTRGLIRLVKQATQRRQIK